MRSMIEVDRALSAKPILRSVAWGPRDVILYHLGIGAGAGTGTAAAGHLNLLYERDLKVLPAFATVPAGPAVLDVNDFPGMGFDFGQVLHAEHRLRLHRDIPSELGAAQTSTRVVDVIDKGSAAIVVVEVLVRDGDGPLATNTFVLMVRGEGGVGRQQQGSPRGPLPDRAPDAVVHTPIAESQAMLYRLSGDTNPLHADPGAAVAAGFDRPILHGLCTYGMVCLAAVDALLNGDVAGVQGYDVRFTGVVYPGETLVSAMWRVEDRILLDVTTNERGSTVLSNAAILVAE